MNAQLAVIPKPSPTIHLILIPLLFNTLVEGVLERCHERTFLLYQSITATNYITPRSMGT
ncbi:MAG: hypothetical protein CSA34_05735 [Desulfobulbus propionicus]|nr:MAG: hypothetical protein CSA34_05735 [Desulfobulbus propionicus]